MEKVAPALQNLTWRAAAGSAIVCNVIVISAAVGVMTLKVVCLIRSLASESVSCSLAA